MDMASHVNDADDNVDAADDDVYAIYVFIAVTTGSNFSSLSILLFYISVASVSGQCGVCVIFNE